ncbi:MAG: hypothetical protein LBF84_01955 [Holosporales bacterium]|nr:hypothetical protein [Holosporales bacterium]
MNISVAMTVLSIRQKSFFITFWLFFQFFVFTAGLQFSFASIAIISMIMAIMLILFFFQKDEVIFTDQTFEQPDTWRYAKKIVNFAFVCVITALAITVKQESIVMAAKPVATYDYAELQFGAPRDHSEYFLLSIVALLVLLAAAGGVNLLHHNSSRRFLTSNGSNGGNK